MKKKMACNENIIYSINEILKKEAESQIKDCDEFHDPDLLSLDLVECCELCDKLLNYNYFEESESLIDQAIAAFNRGECKLKNWLRKLEWSSIYRYELREKKKDMARLFELIVKSSEDWC